MKHSGLIGATAAVTVVAMLGLSTLFAQSRAPTAPKKQETKAKEVTLIGKVVDLQCYMTEEYPTKDKVECARRCIRAGVPVALETETGLVIVGMGQRGPAKEVEKHALALVEVKGKLYEKHGIKYVDITSVKAAKPAEPEPEPEEDWEWPEDDEDEDQDAPDRP